MTTIGIIHGEDTGQELPEELSRLVRCSKCGFVLPLKDVETSGDLMPLLYCPACRKRIEEIEEETNHE